MQFFSARSKIAATELTVYLIGDTHNPDDKEKVAYLQLREGTRNQRLRLFLHMSGC